MKCLSKNWITEGWIDLEYKQYILLDYLQYIDQEMSAQKLYPHFPELVTHYSTLQKFKSNENELLEATSMKIDQLDLDNLKFRLAPKLVNAEEIESLVQIVDFALPMFEERILTGRALYDQVEDAFILRPLKQSYTPNKGFVVFEQTSAETTKVYAYEIYRKGDGHEGASIKTKYFSTYQNNTPAQEVAQKLLKHDDQSHVVGVKARKEFPLHETLLPVMRRAVCRVLTHKMEVIG